LSELASVVGFSTPVCAQTTIDVGPLLGYYRPLGDFAASSVYSTSLPSVPSDLRAVTRGGAVHISFGRRLAVEGQLSVANSTVPGGNTPAGPSGPTEAQELVATLQGQYDVSPAPERLHLWLGVGPGLIRHGGDAYAKYGSPVSMGGALGVGIAVPIRFHLQLAAGATMLRYPFDVKMPPELQGNPGSLQHGVQTDALIHLGVRWGSL
jgi:hypothetical protein